MKIVMAMPLYKSSIRDEWDLCIDGVWYRADFEGADASEKAMLQQQIEEKGLEIKKIPFWNSCDAVAKTGYKNIVYLDSGNAYLIKTDSE